MLYSSRIRQGWNGDSLHTLKRRTMKKYAMIGTKGMNVGPDAFGGFETVVTELAPRLVSAGHEVTVFGRRRAVFG